MPIAIVNIGGVRGEEELLEALDPNQHGEKGVRVELPTDELLPALVTHLRSEAAHHSHDLQGLSKPLQNFGGFKDMLS